MNAKIKQQNKNDSRCAMSDDNNDNTMTIIEWRCCSHAAYECTGVSECREWNANSRQFYFAKLDRFGRLEDLQCDDRNWLIASSINDLSSVYDSSSRKRSTRHLQCINRANAARCSNTWRLVIGDCCCYSCRCLSLTRHSTTLSSNRKCNISIFFRLNHLATEPSIDSQSNVPCGVQIIKAYALTLPSTFNAACIVYKFGSRMAISPLDDEDNNADG